MSRVLAEAASRFLGRRTPRRGFLTKSAVVGSAVAVAPAAYVLRPQTAYAAICNCNGSSCDCSNLCCDGYTEFCCTIYGTNGCPPGSLYGGWWRVSGSSFCGGANRYYMDCHGPCGGCGCGASGVCSGSCNGTACGCALGSCGNRKAGCTHFRYGQCNTQIACLGPIICRVVTCTAPWQLEPNCTTSIRTDEATRFHNRACLQTSGTEPVGALDIVEAGPGTIRVRGWAIDPDILGPVDVNVEVNGSMAGSGPADEPRPDVGSAYSTYGDDHGFDITVSATTGTKEVCVYAVNAGGGENPLLGCATVSVSTGGAAGALESVTAADGGVELTGWAMVAGRTEPIDVDIHLDGSLVATVTADTPRGDLVNTFGDAGDDHGFVTRVDAPGGTHTVCVSTTDPDSGEPVDLGCQSFTTASARPIGAIDAVTAGPGGVRVVGWVHDPDGADAAAVIRVGGVEVATAAPTLTRPDVAAVHGDVVAPGFDTDVQVAAGMHDVCVYAVGSDGVEGPLLACATVAVP